MCDTIHIESDIGSQGKTSKAKGETMKASYESMTRMMLRDADTIKVASKHDMVSVNIYHVIAIVAHDDMDVGDTYSKYPTFAEADRACVAHNSLYLRTHGVVCEVVNMR